MNETPDFTTMTKDEVVAWFMANDTSPVIADAETAAQSMVQVDDRGDPVMRPATFRLPPSIIEWLERAAGRDREGKSGIVRRALQEYRDRHPGATAWGEPHTS